MINRRHFIFGLPLVLAMPAAAQADGGRQSSAIVTRQFLSSLNNYRQGRGLGPLAISAQAEQAALEHSKNMASMGRLTHANFDTRMAQASVAIPAAENIGSGQQTVSEVFTDWRRSSGHRANMLGAYGGVGVAVARDAASGNQPYWTMVLSQ